MKVTREIIKTYILVFLIFAGIILTGNLWRLDNYRLPFVFGEKKPVVKQETYSQFFKPVRIVANDGEERHWILHPFSNADEEDYGKLWDELAYPLIKTILEQKRPVKYESNIAQEEWDKLIAARTLKYEFGAGMENELLTLFLDLPKINMQASVNGITEMVISPQENVNENDLIVYINDVDGKVHRLTVTLENDGYRKTLDAYLKTLSSGRRTRFLTLGEQRHEKIKNVALEPDILVVLPGKDIKNLKYHEVRLSSEFDMDINKMDNISTIAKELLGEDKDNYKRHIDSNGMVSFIHINNERLFRIYPDGFVECYSTAQAESREKTGVKQAFATAVDFIYRYGGIPEGIRPFISGITHDEKNSYTFSFDYFVGGLPVVTSRAYRSDGRLNSAIRIKVVGQNVESYLRYVKRPETGKMLNVGVDSISALNSLFSGDFESGSSRLYNIFLGYDASRNTAAPSWFFDFGEGKLYKVDAVRR